MHSVPSLRQSRPLVFKIFLSLIVYLTNFYLLALGLRVLVLYQFKGRWFRLVSLVCLN